MIAKSACDLISQGSEGCCAGPSSTISSPASRPDTPRCSICPSNLTRPGPAAGRRITNRESARRMRDQRKTAAQQLRAEVRLPPGPQACGLPPTDAWGRCSNLPSLAAWVSVLVRQ